MMRIPEEARRIQDKKRQKVQEQKSSLHLLVESEDEVLNVIEDGYEKIECVIDSGAAESVAPSSIGRGYSIKESEGSKRGQSYLTADGNRLTNQGQKKIPAETNEGNRYNLNFQIAGVTKPLMSVGKVCDAGNIVIFDDYGGRIRNKSTGKTTWFERKNGVYMLSAWTKAPAVSSDSTKPYKQVRFQRQG